MLGSDIPWLCDSIANDLKHALGDRPNSEFVIDPQGRIVRRRAWSRPADLRKDLEELMTYPESGGSLTPPAVLGRHSLTGFDADGNGTLDPASMDRITESEQFYEKDADGWWSVALRKTYHGDNNGSAYRFSRQRTLMSRDLGERTISERGLFDGAESIHESREITRTYDPVAGTVTTSTVTAVKAGVETSATSVSAFGFAVEEGSPFGGNPSTFAYDSQGRLVATTTAQVTGKVLNDDDQRRINDEALAKVEG